MEFDTVIRDAELNRLAKELEEQKSANQRLETFGAAACALCLTLIRELMIEEILPKDRALRMVQASVGTLRRLYHVEHGDPFADDQIDFDRLFAKIDVHRHEKHAEEFLLSLIESLRRRD